jgi:hypothetical protein
MKIETVLGIVVLVGTLAVTGCDSGSKSSEAKKEGPVAGGAGMSKEHAHGQGPNGGVLFDLGKYHAEFTVDHGKAEVTVLMIGDDEKTPVAVAAKELTVSIKETKTKEGKVVAPMTFKLLPKDEAGGKASKFVGTDPGIGNVADFAGTVLGEIDGKPSQGEFEE